MTQTGYPGNFLIGNIVVYTRDLSSARRVAALVREEIALRHVTSGVVLLDGVSVRWHLISSNLRADTL